MKLSGAILAAASLASLAEASSLGSHSDVRGGAVRKHHGTHRAPPRSLALGEEEVSVRNVTVSTQLDERGNSGGQWKLKQQWSGNQFFNNWDFYTGGDPTNGMVQYVSSSEAWNQGLVAINNAQNAIIGVQQTKYVGSVRNSVRLTSQQQFNGGLFILDAVHMPSTCGVWPAFWTNGGCTWPECGEIDIVEGVSLFEQNQMSIHTTSGCSITQSVTGFLGKLAMSGWQGTNCDADATNDQGCAIRASTKGNYGQPYNQAGGGVHAMKWDNSGIAIWFFPRNSIPGDIQSGNPNPNNWGTAEAMWPSNKCNPFEFFKNHNIVFDLTLCGTWASGVWNQGNQAGQSQSCAQSTGFSSCEEYVKQNGDKLGEAYWEVKSVKVYEQS